MRRIQETICKTTDAGGKTGSGSLTRGRAEQKGNLLSAVILGFTLIYHARPHRQTQLGEDNWLINCRIVVN